MRLILVIGGSVLAVVAGAVVLTLALTARTHTPPFVDASGAPVPGAIAEERQIVLGGWPHYVLLRGRDGSAPFLLFLHGGPGASEMPIWRVYNADLENDFLTVNWDQRGTGKSYSADLDPATLTLDRMTRDLDELIDTLQAEFGPRPLLLVGHSWGTILGLEYITRHPNKVSAYVGIGQVSDMAASEEQGYAWTLAEARRRGDGEAVAALEKIGPPPYSQNAMMTQRGYLTRYGGAFHEPRSLPELVLTALRAPEVSWPDLIAFVRGQELSLDALWGHIAALDATSAYPRVGVPVAFFLGRHDRQVSAELAAAYFDALEAPEKRLVWFERSAHSPPFEEPEKFHEQIRAFACAEDLSPC